MIAAVVVTTLTYFPVGYHHSVLNVAHEVFERLINDSFNNHYNVTPSDTTLSTIWSVSVTAWEVGAAFASFNAFWVVERYGRKVTLLIFGSLLQLVGSIMMAISVPSNCFEFLISGRFFCGLSAGLVCPTLRIFLSECSPDSHRGTLNSIAGFVMFVAALIAMGLGLPECFGTDSMSPYLCGFCAIFSIVTLCVYPCFPSTPTYLYLSRRKSVAAAESLKFYHGSHINVKDAFEKLNRERNLTSSEMSLKGTVHSNTVTTPSGSDYRNIF